MKVKLSNCDQYTIIDDNIKEKITKFNWYLSKNGYAFCTSRKNRTLLHRYILGISDSKIRVDHINRNKLDNRIENLRIANSSQNGMNREKQKNNLTSKYKGVSFDKNRNKWRAYITINGKTIHLGRFCSEKDAAAAYNKAALSYHKEFSCINENLND